MAKFREFAAIDHAHHILVLKDGRVEPLALNSGDLLLQKQDHFPIYVRQNSDFRWLHFGTTAIQSLMSLRRGEQLLLPYTQALMAWRLFKHQLHRALIVGIGGGALARYLRAQYPAAHIAGIDISAEIVNVSYRFFSLHAAVDQITVTDASALRAATYSDRFELILLDIHYQHHASHFLTDKNYYQHCFDLLEVDGILVLNLLPGQGSDRVGVPALIAEVFEGMTLTLPVPQHDNLIVLAFKQAPATTRLSRLMQNASTLSKQSNVDYVRLMEQLTQANQKSNGCLVCGRIYS